MDLKKAVWGGATIGSILGSFVPQLWGDDSMLSISSIIFSGLGALLGIYLGYKLVKD